MPTGTPSAASYAAATDSLRAATRWLLTAAAAAGAAMVAGLQLSSIGSLGSGDWPRLIAAGTGLAAGLGAVGYMIFHTSRLLTDEWITFAELELDQFKQQLHSSSSRRDRKRAAAIDRIYQELEVSQNELYGNVAGSISDLYSQLVEANNLARRSTRRPHAQKATDLRSAAETLVQAANYSYIRADFTVLRKQLIQAGAVFVLGIVIFAYAASPAKPAAQDSTTSRTAPTITHPAGQTSTAAVPSSVPSRRH